MAPTGSAGHNYTPQSARRIRRLPRDGHELLPLHAAMHHGVHQPLRIRVRWLLQDIPYWPICHDTPGIHDCYFIRYCCGRLLYTWDYGSVLWYFQSKQFLCRSVMVSNALMPL